MQEGNWPTPEDAAAARLDGRVVLVTGATGGLGREVSLACARAGATVVLLARRLTPLERLYDELVAAGAPEPAIQQLDLAGADAAACATVADGIVETCGRLDAVVFAHAHFESLSQFGPARCADWDKAMRVNATATGLLAACASPALAATGAGSLLFVLDDPARVGRAYWGGYGVSKLAVAALADQLADEWEAGPIRVQAVQPAPMGTRLRNASYVGLPNEVLLAPADLASRVPALLGPGGEATRNCLLRWPIAAAPAVVSVQQQGLK
jgi:NAD(P)-dependent dehydrogenase (short-subunit alcohol dehydrogenase family)